MSAGCMQTLTSHTQSRARKVWIVEGGYCTDTRFTDKYGRKETQHEHLYQTLKAQGFEL